METTLKPKTLYHLTLAAFIESILRKGLLPSVDELFLDDGGYEEAVNLSIDLERNYRAPDPNEDVLCIIDTTALDHSKLVQIDDWWFRYHGVIPPNAITIRTISRGMK